MPSTATITSFYEFAPTTVIKSAEMNSNFQNFRGHYLPINTDTATASDLTHNLGAIDHYWKSSYIQEHYQKEISTGSTPPANSFNSYFKSDGKKYKKNSSDVERTFLDTDLVLAKGDLLVGLGANTLTALTIGANDYVLTADSATTTGMAWKKNVSTLLTTKGDLFAFDTAPARLPVGTDGQVLTADSATITGMKWETKSSGGGINYILNPNGDSALTGWATFADAAASTPVDGTGGVANSTFEISATTPIRGLGSFLWTKSANNRQGEGYSYNFTIDAADKAKVLTASFEYQVASGTYADDEMTVWIYDVTNAALIQPAPYKIKNTGAIEKLSCEFQTASNSTSYRLIVYTSGTSSSAYTMKFDNFSVGPNAKYYGSVVTDWNTTTSTWTSTGTQPAIGNGSITTYWRRVGGNAEIKINIISGTTTTYGTGFYSFGLPTGLSIDFSKTKDYYGTSSVYKNAGAYNTYVGKVIIGSSTSVRCIGTGVSVWTEAVPVSLDAATANHTIVLDFSVPIVGWSSSTIMSSDAATNVVATNLSGPQTPTGTLTNSYNVVKYPTVTNNQGSGNYDTATGLYTVGVPGKYKICGVIEVTSSFTVSQQVRVAVYKNGSNFVTGNGYDARTTETAKINSLVFNGCIDCIAGDTLGVYVYTSGTSNSYSITMSGSSVTFERISGPAQIAASETVSALYTTGSGTLGASGNIVKYTTKVFDTHNSYNISTGFYTVPISGKYRVTSSLQVSYASASIGNSVQAQIIQAGSATPTFKNIAIVQDTSVLSQNPVCITVLNCLAGDTIAGYSYTNTNTPTFGADGASTTFITIERIGNY